MNRGEQMGISQIHLRDGWTSPYQDYQVNVAAMEIRRNGFQKPIRVDANNTILAGHLAYLAALQLEWCVVPVLKTTLRLAA